MEEKREGLEVLGCTCAMSGSLFRIMTDELHVLPTDWGKEEAGEGSWSCPACEAVAHCKK